MEKITYYEKNSGEIFSTTAIYPNRIKDKQKLEEMYGHSLSESGSENVRFFTQLDSLVAEKYIRIVYGDHGPYVEFLKNQIIWDQWYCERSGVGYYNKWYPKDGWNILLYEQMIEVRNLSNPPKDGFQGNRKEGYADYRKGRVYINPYDLVIEFN